MSPGGAALLRRCAVSFGAVGTGLKAEVGAIGRTRRVAAVELRLRGKAQVKPWRNSLLSDQCTSGRLGLNSRGCYSASGA